MKHWWVRDTKGFSALHVIYECTHCGTRKKYIGNMGRRGGTRIAFKLPGDREYRVLWRTPLCYDDPKHHALR